MASELHRRGGRSTPKRLAVAVALVASALSVAGAPAVAAGPGPGAPTHLTVNGMQPATGVDPDGVSFAWRVQDASRGAMQTAYRIRVTRSRRVVWDSGRVRSGAQAFVAYRGPRLAGDAEYSWTVATAGAGSAWGPFAAPQTFVTVPRDGDWRAQWVRPGPATPSPDQYTYVRTSAHLARSPVKRATAFVAAAHRYQLWINGRFADAGPSFSYPDEQYVQSVDVTRFVRVGRTNGIGVLHHWYGGGQGRPASEPGLLVEISVDHRDGTHETIGTGGRWREQAAEWSPGTPRNEEGDFTEVVDARRHPDGWSTAGFDDTSWRPVAVLGPPGVAPFLRLVPQRTRIATHPVRPVSVKRLPSGAAVADYGAVYAASPVVSFRHGAPGRTVTLRAGFALDPDGSVSATHLNQGTDMSDTYTERGGRETYAAYGYLAFQYLEVDGAQEPLSAAQLTITARHAAVPDERAGTFRSSDRALDAVWKLTRRSALYASQEQFVDTPTREKGQFLLDAYDESQATTRAFGEQDLTWQALRDFARSQARYWPDGRLNVVYPNGDGARDIPDNTERYPDWVWQYYLATGDRASLAAFAPVATRVAEYVAAAIDPATRLVTTLPGGDGDYLNGAVDWPPPMRYGYDMTSAARTTVNALAVQAFDRVAREADALGDSTAATTWRGRRDALIAAINTRLRRPDGVYVDGLHADGSTSDHASQQANAFALATGVVPAPQQAAVGRYVAGLGVALGPDNGLVLLQALHAAGRAADVQRTLTNRSTPGWAAVLAAGGTFTWETWAPSDADGDGTSHGWGSSALAAYPLAFLGVSPLPTTGSTGARLAIAQPTGGPARVAGTVPTVSGPVTVTWSRAGLRLMVPPNAQVALHLRGRRPRTVRAGTWTFPEPRSGVARQPHRLRNDAKTGVR